MLEPFLGMIQYFGFNFAPYGYQMCNGQIIPISSNTALFSLLGTFYGGDGRSTFGLPDGRGRSLIGFNNNVPIGEAAGKDASLTLTINNLPNHTHAANVQIGCNNGNGGTASPLNAFPAVDTSHNTMYDTPPTSGAVMGAPLPVTVGNAGAGTPVATLAPYLAVSCAIAMQGIFPTRS
jgi:microcystin-dependent protein